MKLDAIACKLDLDLLQRFPLRLRQLPVGEPEAQETDDAVRPECTRCMKVFVECREYVYEKKAYTPERERA